MGNCLKGQNADDVSLLRGGDGIRESSSSDQIHGGDIYQEPNVPVYYPSPNVRRPVNQLTEEEQVKIAKRIGLIQNLPSGIYDATAKSRECVICMIDFVQGDRIRYMPCMHVYHVQCIDDWLMRSFTCPSCMEPVDRALLNTYQTAPAPNPTPLLMMGPPRPPSHSTFLSNFSSQTSTLIMPPPNQNIFLATTISPPTSTVMAPAGSNSSSAFILASSLSAPNTSPNTIMMAPAGMLSQPTLTPTVTPMPQSTTSTTHQQQQHRH